MMARAAHAHSADPPPLPVARGFLAAARAAASAVCNSDDSEEGAPSAGESFALPSDAAARLQVKTPLVPMPLTLCPSVSHARIP